MRGSQRFDWSPVVAIPQMNSNCAPTLPTTRACVQAARPEDTRLPSALEWRSVIQLTGASDSRRRATAGIFRAACAFYYYRAKPVNYHWRTIMKVAAFTGILAL